MSVKIRLWCVEMYMEGQYQGVLYYLHNDLYIVVFRRAMYCTLQECWTEVMAQLFWLWLGGILPQPCVCCYCLLFYQCIRRAAPQPCNVGPSCVPVANLITSTTYIVWCRPSRAIYSQPTSTRLTLILMLRVSPRLGPKGLGPEGSDPGLGPEG